MKKIKIYLEKLFLNKKEKNAELLNHLAADEAAKERKDIEKVAINLAAKNISNKSSIEDVLSILTMFGGNLGGSRLINFSDSMSDYDIFFLREIHLEIAKKFLEKIGYVFGYFYSDTEEFLLKHGGRYYAPKMGVRTVQKFIKTPSIAQKGRVVFHLVLVNKLLSKEEQIFLHLEKYPKKIKEKSLPNGWESWVCQKKLTPYLSKDQRDNFILWFSENYNISG